MVSLYTTARQRTRTGAKMRLDNGQPMSNLWYVMKHFSRYGTVVKRLETVAGGGEGTTMRYGMLSNSLCEYLLQSLPRRG